MTYNSANVNVKNICTFSSRGDSKKENKITAHSKNDESSHEKRSGKVFEGILQQHLGSKYQSFKFSKMFFSFTFHCYILKVSN